MEVGKRRLGSILAILSYIGFCYGKAVPDESPGYYGGYEYTYNFQNGEHEVRPLYDEDIPIPSGQRGWGRPYGGHPFNHKPVFVPPTKQNGDLNKILKEYYNSRKLDSIYKEMGMQPEDYTHKQFTKTSTAKSPMKYSEEEYEDDYYRSPVISNIRKKPVKVYENEAHCTDCHIPTEHEIHNHKKMNSNVKKAYKPKYVHQPKGGTSYVRNHGIKYTDKFEIATDTPSEYTHSNSMAHKGLNINRKKYDGKYPSETKAALEDRMKYLSNVREISPQVVQSSVQYDSEIKDKLALKRENEYSQLPDSSEVKVIRKVKSAKHKGTLEPESKDYRRSDNSKIKSDDETMLNEIEDFDYEEGEVLEPENLTETDESIELEDEDYDEIIPILRIKSKLENKENTKCKQNEKSEANSAVCSVNENKSKPPEPDIVPPKIVSAIKKPSVQSSESYTSKPNPEFAPPKVVSVKSKHPSVQSLNYDKNKAYIKSETMDFAGIESTSEETSNIEESNRVNNLIDELPESNTDEQMDTKLEILNENLNFARYAEHKLDLEAPGSGIGMGDNHFNDISGIDDKFKSSFRNSNIWSLIFNPDAKDHKLKTCLTRNNESGFCMYIQQCPVLNIATSLEQLLNNACVVDEVFIGVCCPEFPVETVQVDWEDTETNSSDKVDEPDVENEDCGTRSDSSKFQSCPWKAPLVSMSNGKIFCGGVVIGKEYILTAAHCTTKIPKNQILVRLGQHDDASGEDFAVTEIKRHAQYNPRTQQNDIALLKLGRRVPFTDHISMICLPDEEDGDFSGEKSILIGWQGVIGDNPKKSEFLQVINNEECQRKMNTNIPPSLLCTEARNEDEITCNADSGSPLVIDVDDRLKVIGILSWNRNDCDKRFPAIFSRVSNYIKWIERHAV